MTGWWYFFPYTVLVKTPLPLFLLLILAGAGAIVGWRQVSPRTWHTMCAICVAGVLRHGALMDSLDRLLGHGRQHETEHRPPAHPAHLSCDVDSRRGRQPLVRRTRPTAMDHVVGRTVVRVPFGGRVLGHVSSLFGLFQLDRRRPRQRLQASRRQLARLGPRPARFETVVNGARSGRPGPTPVYLAYFGRTEPAYYHIRATELCGPRQRSLSLVPLTEGVYCISATELQRVYSRAPGHGAGSTKMPTRKRFGPFANWRPPPRPRGRNLSGRKAMPSGIRCL